MPKLSDDLENIIKANPNVDPNKLQEARKLHRQLREKRAEGGSYRIAPPMTRRRVSVTDEEADDPRTVQLRSHR